MAATRFDPARCGLAQAYLGSPRWNRLCTIPSNPMGGRYEVRVTNAGEPAASADGSNNFGIVARYPDGPGHGLCTTASDATCPAVAGIVTASVYTVAQESVVDLALADVGPEHAGRVLEVELFDPGEGGSFIELLAPTGPDSWSPVPFVASWPGSTLANVTQLNVTNNRFNGVVVTLRADLAGYDPPPSNHQWKVRYEFNDPHRPTVTDRTTWDVAVVDHA